MAVEASGHYLEDYLQYIKSKLCYQHLLWVIWRSVPCRGAMCWWSIALPNDLQRTFLLMAELDQKAEGEPQQVYILIADTHMLVSQ
jgi:hypothetical protein